MIGITRRSLIVGAATLAAGNLIADASEIGLASVAASKGLKFGSLVQLTPSIVKVGVLTDPAYEQMIVASCNLYVTGSLFWKRVSPTPGAADFSKGDAAASWAHSQGMVLRGGPLAWHYQTPSWYEALTDADTAKRALEDHIRGICGHFAGRMHSWDVVNEPIFAGERPDGLRNNVFLQRLGPRYIDVAFRAARVADPSALLVLNENSLEYDTENQRTRRDALLRLVDGMLERGTPIDVIGLQSHLATGYASHLDEESLSRFLRAISSRGLKIMITELDVNDRESPADINKRDDEVASLYRRYLDVALENMAMIAVITWGLTDRESWITRGDLPDFRRSDGLAPRPLLFDENYAPKKAYESVRLALRNAPAR